jgi:hypothetical protein
VSFKLNLEKVAEKYNLKVPENLFIKEDNHTVILTIGDKLTRLFAKSSFNIEILEQKVLINNVYVLEGEITSDLKERSNLLLDVNESLYDRPKRYFEIED